MLARSNIKFNIDNTSNVRVYWPLETYMCQFKMNSIENTSTAEPRQFFKMRFWWSCAVQGWTVGMSTTTAVNRITLSVQHITTPRVTFHQGLSQKPALITTSLSYNRAYAIGPGVRLGLGACALFTFWDMSRRSESIFSGALNTWMLLTRPQQPLLRQETIPGRGGFIVY